MITTDTGCNDQTQLYGSYGNCGYPLRYTDDDFDRLCGVATDESNGVVYWGGSMGDDLNKDTSAVGHYHATNADIIEYCQDSARKWAQVFMDEWCKRGWSMVDLQSMTTWFANAIEHSCDYRLHTGRYIDPTKCTYNDCPTRNKCK